MAKLQLISLTTLIIVSFLNVTHSLYEDQVGKFDWKQNYVGKPKFAKFDNKRVVVATEDNVLASLHLKSGQIAWRHILEDPLEQQIQFLALSNEVITVSGAKNSWYVRGCDTSVGTMLWEWTIYSEKVLNSYWTLVDEKLYHVSPNVGSHLEITSYNVKTGENRGKSSKISTAWIVNLSQCVLSGANFACISSEDSSGSLYYLDITSNEPKVINKPLSNLISGAETSSKVAILNLEHVEDAILLIRNNVARVVLLKGAPEVVPYGFLSNVISTNGILYQLEASDNPEKLIKVKSRNIETGNEQSFEVEYPKGLGAPYTLAGQCKGSICDFLLTSTDNALVLIRLPEGKVLWTREEALSNIVAVEFFELPVSEMESSIESEFETNNYYDVVTMFLKRIGTQYKQLNNLIFGNVGHSSSVLVRDDFGLHKIILAVTAVGKIFAIDTLSGQTVWSYRLPQVGPFLSLNKEGILLFVQRTARYAPLPAQATLLAQDLTTSQLVVFQFDPITGYSKEGLIKMPFQLQQAMLLPYEDEDHLKPILILSNTKEITILPPKSTDLLLDQAKSTYLYTVDGSTSELVGYSLRNSDRSGLKISKMWGVSLAPGKIVDISTRPLTERVHSQGRVLPDRSVYYKYVNPNLISIATLTNDPTHRRVLSVYLIDGVTGLVLYSTSHKRAKSPVHLVHSENWIVYSYFNERFRRTEVVAAEMYEGNIQSNSSYFSSHAVSQLPHIQTQSYILPASPSALKVTLTERGITSKCVLVALTDGSVSEIPWIVLQPRFADIPCGPEESCYPYMPELPLPHEATLNYNQTLGRIKSIAVAPARLESTSHVLVYGLDLFYTRVAPSKTFDVLKEDFDHGLIILVLAGLIIASYITKYLAGRKALRQAWK